MFDGLGPSFSDDADRSQAVPGLDENSVGVLRLRLGLLDNPLHHLHHTEGPVLVKAGEGPFDHLQREGNVTTTMDFYIVHGLILCLLKLSKKGQILLMCYKYLIKNNYKCIEISEL